MIVGIGLDVVETAKGQQLLAAHDQHFAERVPSSRGSRDAAVILEG